MLYVMTVILCLYERNRVSRKLQMIFDHFERFHHVLKEVKQTLAHSQANGGEDINTPTWHANVCVIDDAFKF